MRYFSGHRESIRRAQGLVAVQDQDAHGQRQRGPAKDVSARRRPCRQRCVGVRRVQKKQVMQLVPLRITDVI